MAQTKSGRQSLDLTIEQFDSKFRFVLLAAGRAEQLVRGARPKLELPLEKPTRLAMEEVQRGMVSWDYGPAPEPEATADGSDEGVEAVGEEPEAEAKTH